MRIITIEDTAYRVTEKVYKALLAKKAEIDAKPYYHSSDVDMNDFVQSLKPQFKRLGYVDFDYRL